MSVNSEFVDIVVSFELYRHAFPNMSPAELHYTAHRFNERIKPLVEDISQLEEADGISAEERTFHLCRIEKLSEMTLRLSIEIDRRIRLAAY